MEENFFENETPFESEENVSHMQKWKSVLSPTAVSDNNSGSFDCNICLDAARDPVVTLCGHLYCWPCIYKWLHVCSSSNDPDPQQPNCPVCKASISSNSVVPLYGRGASSSESEPTKAPRDVVVPRRPPPFRLDLPISNNSQQSQQFHPNDFQSQLQPFHHQQYFSHPYGGYATMASSNFGSTTFTSLFNPMIGMVGELMFARILGTSHPSLLAYSYPNSYLLTGTSSPRMRRQEMQLEKSLHRITIFLVCCIILCLFLF
uniref:E3 ubiquitin-protein ligase RMA n=1 Tax=Rhizophora mucronata TaxID=61149 RepID=A0A2P2K2G8_RHIMU